MWLALPERPGLFAVAAILAAAVGLVQSSPLQSADSATSGYAPAADPLAPVTVGPRDAVGKKSAGSKVVGGLLGGVLGGSGSGGGKSAQPRTHRDPTRKLDYAPFEAHAKGLETGARATWTDDGLLVSTRIEDADDKGTFQTVFLQTCDGRRLYPQDYEIFKLWAEGSLSVSWSKTSTVDGQVVSHESGGWNDSWTEDLGTPGRDSGATPAMPATWQQLGFDRAEGGARQLGSYFNLSADTLAGLGEISLFAHTTLPGEDPVTTVASHWLVRPGAEGGVDVLTADAPLPDGEASAWHDWSDRCGVVSPVLVAAAGAAPLAAASTDAGGDAAASPGAAARRGYPLPPGVTVSRPRGTGRTTGHIADLTVSNDSDQPVTFPDMPFYIPSTGKYQSYVGAPGKGTEVPPGATVEVPIEGYCGDVRRPPVPAGDPIPPPEEWVVPGDPAAPVHVPPRDGAGPPGNVTFPGTDTPLPRAVDPDEEPLVAAPLLFGAIEAIERATVELQDSGALKTPFSGNPDREREAVAQQTYWRFAAELEGEPYTKEEFTERLEAQYEQNTGVPITAAPPEDRERVQQGADDFWGAFELVGLEAKVISHPEGATAAAAGEEDSSEPEPIAGATAEPEPPNCKANKSDDHTPPTVHVIVSDSYGNEDDRAKIRNGIRKAVEESSAAYATATPPSTAFSLWGHDHIGGYSSAYAKVVFLEDNDQEWVWWTDPLTTTARGNSTHRLSFTHGEECTSIVAGASMMWLKTSSEAFDPLERSIEYFRALDAVKEVTVKYLADKLPPGLDEALEAGVEAITDPSSDTYAAATGAATITVGGHRQGGSSVNRVVYKRKDKEDKAIIGGGESIKKLFASDVRPGGLISSLEAEAKLEAGAQGNGFAKAYLESLYGTLMIGVCECPTGAIIEVVGDSGQFIKSEGGAEAAKRGKREIDEAADRITKDFESGALESDAQVLKGRAAAELRRWGDSLGGDRFKPKPESPKQ